MEVNEYLLSRKDDDKNDHTPPSVGKTGDDGTAKEETTKGTLTLDATCAPTNIHYPQDISLLNETREKQETMIYRFCKCYGLKLPRRYRKCARKEYLAFVKSRKHTAKKPRNALRKQLSYAKRDLGYLEQFMSYGMSCITTKLEETQLTSIALSVFVTNLFRIQRRILYALLHLFRFWRDWNRCKSWKMQISA